jgi:hypothetical protein
LSSSRPLLSCAECCASSRGLAVSKARPPGCMLRSMLPGPAPPSERCAGSGAALACRVGEVTTFCSPAGSRRLQRAALAPASSRGASARRSHPMSSSELTP